MVQGSNPVILRTKGLKLSKLGAVALLFIFTFLTIYYWSGTGRNESAAQVSESKPSSSPSDQAVSATSYLLGDNEDSARLWFPPIQDASAFKPLIASYNKPPPIGERPRTPLLVGFTRNNAMLQQTVLSYIAAGWPREDIIVIDNSGTMDANNRGLLSVDNPFFLDYATLRSRYGVSVLQTPTLLSFAQLQNFFLRISLAHNWRFFFWSHMDIAVLSDEKSQPYKSFYQRVLEILDDLGISSLEAASASAAASVLETESWALKYFTYDWLTLINVRAWRTIGPWDTFIPYYASDCDAYSRLALHGFTKGDVRAGHLFDVPRVVQGGNPETKFFPPPLAATDQKSEAVKAEEQPNSPRYQALLAELRSLQDDKPENSRNKWQWQGSSTARKGEPWTYDPDGFQAMWWDTAGFGREMYKKKWGTEECRLDAHGWKLEDAFTRKEEG